MIELNSVNHVKKLTQSTHEANFGSSEPQWTSYWIDD